VRAALPINASSAPLATPSQTAIAATGGAVTHHRGGANATTRHRLAATA